jgi:hypothetical protein
MANENFNIVYQRTFLDILTRMAKESRTGVLRSLSSKPVFEIHLDQGWVVNVTGEFDGEPSIEEIIAKSGFLSRAEFQRILKRVKKADVPFVTYVIQKGLFSDVFLRRIVENIIRERLDRLMDLQNFGVTFDRAPPTPLKNLSFIHLPAYLRRYRNEFQAREAVRKRFTDDQVVPDKTARDTRNLEDDPAFDVDARIVYFFVNGRRTLRDIQYISGLGYVRAGSALIKLLNAGVIELAREQKQPEKRPGVVSQVVFVGVLPLVFFGVFVAAVSLSPLTRGVQVYDAFTVRRAQVVHLFREAQELFRRMELREPRNTEELFQAGLLPDQWRTFKRHYENALRGPAPAREAPPTPPGPPVEVP